MTTDAANAVYDILVSAGAIERDRESFVLNQTNHHIVEWRFMGALGFGGKFWRSNGRWYVTCYSEDRTPARDALIDATNNKLAALSPGEGN